MHELVHKSTCCCRHYYHYGEN